jgi:Initiator Replication protein
MSKLSAPDSPPVGRTLKAAHMAAQSIPDTEIVKAGELVEARFARGASPSAPARKVLALLIQKAAGGAWKPGPHSILKRELRGSHKGNERLPGIFDELQGTLLRIETVAPDGRAAALVAPVIAYRIEHLEDDDGSCVWWEFSEPARRAMQGSDYYAAMNRGTLLAFGSRYAVTLYERGCLLAGRREPRWRGSVGELREVMGVQLGVYRDWGDIRARVVEPAIAEVNQMADFVASYRVENGPRNKVVAVELWFRPKDSAGRNAAAAELNRSSVGRKVRRQGRVETVRPLSLPD